MSDDLKTQFEQALKSNGLDPNSIDFAAALARGAADPVFQKIAAAQSGLANLEIQSIPAEFAVKSYTAVVPSSAPLPDAYMGLDTSRLILLHFVNQSLAIL